MRTGKLLTYLIVSIMIAGTIPVFSGASEDIDSRDADNNGDFATADPVISNQITLVGDLTGVGDPFDYYKIELNNSGVGNAERLRVNATSNGNGAIKLNIYDPDTYWVVADLVFGQTSYLEVIPEWSGWYYVGIEGQGMTFPYSITFDKVSVAWTGDSNTDAANATVVATFPFETTESYDNKSDPQDFYKINLERVPGDHTDILMVKFTPPTDPAKAIPEMYYASNNTGVTGMVMQKGSSWINPPAGNIFTFAPEVTGDYLIRVWGYEGQTNYDIKMKKVTATEDTNNDQASAEGLLDAGDNHHDTGSGVIAQSVDGLDYFKFTGKSGMHINATLDSTDYDLDMNLPTIYLTLYNSTGHDFAQAELDVYKWSADPLAYVEGDLPKNETYYLEIKALGGAGNYGIDLVANTPPQVVADWLDQSFEMFIWENDMNDSLKLDQVFMDFDGDPMTYTTDTASNPNLTVTIDAGTSKATYTPTQNFKGVTCANITAEDSQGAKGTVEICAKVYGVNHEPYIMKQFNETYTNAVLGIKFGKVVTEDLTNYLGDIDPKDKHWFSVEGNDKVAIYFAEETPIKPEHYHTGIITIVAPNEEVVESVQFYSKDNGWPSMTSPPLNLTIQVSSGIVKVESKPGGQLNIDEDSFKTFPVKEYIYFKPPPPPDDEIVYSEQSSDNVTITITEGIANITPQADWCGNENVVFWGDAVKNKISNSTNLKVSVSCINDPPVLKAHSPDGKINMSEGESKVFEINVTDLDTEPTLMRYQWLVDDVQQASVTNIFTYKPGFTDAGSHVIKVVFNDTEFEGSYTWEDVVVEDLNRLPVNVRIIEPDNNITVKKGKKVSFRAGTATDPDSDPLTYTWYDGTEEMDKNQTLEHKFKKKGEHTIKLEVSDGRGGVVSVEIVIKVKAPQQDGPGFEALILVIALVAAVMILRKRKEGR